MTKFGSPIIRGHVRAGPPYLFSCRRCRHRFVRRIRWGMCCPHCLALSPRRVPVVK